MRSVLTTNRSANLGIPLILFTSGAWLLALGPVRRGERWALALLALLLVCGQGSYFIALGFIPGGAPPEAYAHIGSAISAGLYTVGLVLVATVQRSS